MVLRRIKYVLENIWDRIVGFFEAVVFFVLVALFIIVALSPVVIPVVIGYAVFVVVSSDFDPLVKGIIFAVYSAGLFIYGAVVESWAFSDVRKEVREGVELCEKKVAPIMDDAKRCKSVKSSIESKVYDVMLCLDAIRRKV